MIRTSVVIRNTQLSDKDLRCFHGLCAYKTLRKGINKDALRKKRGLSRFRRLRP